MLLSKIPYQTVDIDAIARRWRHHQDDICTSCHLRPQGPSPKAKDRKVCDICEDRRADRSQAWATTQRGKTIWTAEVGDSHGRLALLVGQFDLRRWLDGSMVETLLVIAPGQSQESVSKTPSFSRLRRIWETTRTFWQEVQNWAFERLSDDRRRLKIYLTDGPDLGPYHVYDLQLGETELDVVWVPPQNGEEGYLLSADNLGYIARRLRAGKEVYADSKEAAKFVRNQLQQQTQPVLYNPDASAAEKRINLLEGISFRDLQYQENRYATAIPILSEPRLFMMIVPADKALDIVNHIHEKYKNEMGKVRNRLPLALGLVFFGRKMPLLAVLDAGRQMLDRPEPAQTWQVTGKTDLDLTAENWPREVQLALARDGQEITLTIPTVMGDDETPDPWYPYWRVEGQPKRRYWFPGADGEHWVHVKDLKPGDTVHFTPATLDFLWLDSAARRFEAGAGHPFPLEYFLELEKWWSERLRCLTKTQLKGLIQTIETARQRWFGDDRGHRSYSDPTFCRFTADALARAGLLKQPCHCEAQSDEAVPNDLAAEIASPPSAVRNDTRHPETARNDTTDRQAACKDIPPVLSATLRGGLTRLEELHLSILKEDLKEGEPCHD